MLDNNTNKIFWVGVVLGIIGVFGSAVLSLYPDTMSRVKSAVRFQTLSFSETNENLLFPDSNVIKASYFGTMVQGGATGVDYAHVSDVEPGVVNLKLGSTPNHVYGAFLVHNYNDGSGLDVNDKWKLSAEIKSDNPNVRFYTQGSNYTGLGIENSQSSWISNPALSTDWQKYSSTGIRTYNAGAVIVYFVNNSGQPVNIQIKNMTLVRIR